MSANCKYCRKQPAAITATRHRLDLNLAHDLGERVTCTVSLRSI